MFLSVLAPSCKGRRFHRLFRLMAGTAAFCLSSLPVGATEVTDGLLKRILPHGKDASRFTCVIDGSHSGKDWFAISCDGQTVSIKGPNNVSLAAGINWFLNKVGIDISWNMSKAKLPTSLPIVSEETHTSTVDYRYYLNFCTHSYTMAFWDWSRWQQEIDWMALHGINLPLITEGMECVWRKVLMDGYGYDSLDKVNKFVTGPAYFGWFFMNNMTEWGGPLPQKWYDQQEQLAKKIFRRLSEYGITDGYQVIAEFIDLIIEERVMLERIEINFAVIECAVRGVVVRKLNQLDCDVLRCQIFIDFVPFVLIVAYHADGNNDRLCRCLCFQLCFSIILSHRLLRSRLRLFGSCICCSAGTASGCQQCKCCDCCEEFVGVLSVFHKYLLLLYI